ncbi:MAG: hypothetical protein ACK4L7_07175 [Flavobacteriales bacterium]
MLMWEVWWLIGWLVVDARRSSFLLHHAPAAQGRKYGPKEVKKKRAFALGRLESSPMERAPRWRSSCGVARGLADVAVVAYGGRPAASARGVFAALGMA